MDPVEREQQAIVRLLEKEKRFYEQLGPKALRGGPDERERAIYVLSEAAERVRERIAARRPSAKRTRKVA